MLSVFPNLPDMFVAVFDFFKDCFKSGHKCVATDV